MKFVHAADLHLDSPLSGLEAYDGAPVDAIRSATRRAFENLVSLCLEEDARLLLIAGDVYDGNWKDYSTGLFFAAELTRLAAEGIFVVMVRGNHDAASQITRHLSLPKHVFELSANRPETRVFEDVGVAVHGQSFRDRSMQDDLAARYPEPVAGLLNVGLLHTSLTGREGHHDYAPCSLETLRGRGYDYWALGHVHRREIVSEAPYVVFPGNLQGRHIQETGAKGATLVTVEDGKVCALEARPLDVFRFGRAEVDATDAASVDDVVDLARAALEREVLAADGRPLGARVTIRGRTRTHAALLADPDRWEHQIRLDGLEAHGDALWIERVRFETSPRTSSDPGARDDAVSRIVRAVREARREIGEGSLVSVFDELKKRLPFEARDGADAILLDSPEFLDALFDDVERLLVPGLVTDGADE